MKEHKFTWFREFLERKSGIVITKEKAYLVKSRLQPILTKYNADDLNALILKIKQQENSALAAEAIDLMTTNETLFFRDGYPFVALQEHIFPEINQGKGMSSPINIWSAAASRGQEAYSIAMTACEVMPNARQRVQIVGTDLSAESVAFAKQGTYSDIEVKRGVSMPRLNKFFRPMGPSWVVNDDLRAMASFYEGNLVLDTLVTQMHRFGLFDVVFLRNVLIYFSIEERKRVIDRIARTMRKGGYLITGAADLPEGNISKWQRVDVQRQRIWRLC
ncbi:CheR family methyltransferase [Ghiorsea bivora]|uniref:CheR family methyltransferase n=1 Tax=Ghiorsea bivora TaxID=1485545 RepID=UPI00057207FB|nr:protein-glutamate O-methyltransferase CheR [Ghiorsea bivora]